MHKFLRVLSILELSREEPAVARGEHKIGPDEPKVWFESLQTLANALKTDVATVARVLLPPPDSDTDL